MSGQLFLIPTPIAPGQMLESTAHSLLLKAWEQASESSLFLIETPKAGRAQWAQFGLPREAIPHLIAYNEQTRQELLPTVIEGLLQGKSVYLMTDGGLPAFMDPGAELVRACQERKILVRATPFANSVLLALALSGFPHQQFTFEGALPRESEMRLQALKDYWRRPSTILVLDAPYRMQKILQMLLEISSSSGVHRELFLALDLQHDNERHLFFSSREIAHFQRELNNKYEFILVIGPLKFEAGHKKP
ncbi:MAG: hypothetical protein A2X86_15175 [Bdellovibrionales bacterium GWA2_49_15]|nr:MAG: hypothetical protein A2X86_15175 [Bdellovibrionales bacterium GWA2_49_15]